MTFLLALLLGLLIGAVIGTLFGFWLASRVAADSVNRLVGDVILENKRLKQSVANPSTKPGTTLLPELQ